MIFWPAHMCAGQPDDAGGAQSGEAGCRARAKPARNMFRPAGGRMRPPGQRIWRDP